MRYKTDVKPSPLRACLSGFDFGTKPMCVKTRPFRAGVSGFDCEIFSVASGKLVTDLVRETADMGCHDEVEDSADICGKKSGDWA